MKRFLFILLIFTFSPIFSENWAERTLQQLSLREKVGQLFVVETASDFNQRNPYLANIMRENIHLLNYEYMHYLIENYGIGGLIFTFEGDIDQQVYATDRFQSASKIPLLIVHDAENGLFMRFKYDSDVIRFPMNMTLGAIQDEQLIYEVGKEIGKQCRAIGVHLNCAPVVDVNSNPKNPIIGMRSFGDNEIDVARKGILLSKGLQDGDVLSCAKHFPGHGDTATDSHLVLPTIFLTQEEFQQHLYPFEMLIDADVDAIMTAHLSIPFFESDINRASSLNKNVVTDLLKNKLGFGKLIITDSLRMHAVSDHFAPGQLELEAFLAGSDILLCPCDVPKAVECIEACIKNNPELLKQLDESVLKILRVKEQLGLHEKRLISGNYREIISSENAYILKKKLYESAITMVKNDYDLLPLSQEARVSLILAGNQDDIFEISLKELLPQLSAVTLCNSSEPELARVRRAVQDADIIICAVFGFDPYWQEAGTIMNRELAGLKRQQKKVIGAVFGTPYALKFFGPEDALIMAYENDQDAQEAVAKCITGQLKMTGKLPIYNAAV